MQGVERRSWLRQLVWAYWALTLVLLVPFIYQLILELSPGRAGGDRDTSGESPIGAARSPAPESCICNAKSPPLSAAKGEWGRSGDHYGGHDNRAARCRSPAGHREFSLYRRGIKPQNDAASRYQGPCSGNGHRARGSPRKAATGTRTSTFTLPKPECPRACG